MREQYKLYEINQTIDLHLSIKEEEEERREGKGGGVTVESNDLIESKLWTDKSKNRENPSAASNEFSTVHFATTY